MGYSKKVAPKETENTHREILGEFAPLFRTPQDYTGNLREHAFVAPPDFPYTPR